MKNLEINQMEVINGGSDDPLTDAFCMAAEVACRISPNPIICSATIICALRGLF